MRRFDAGDVVVLVLGVVAVLVLALTPVLMFTGLAAAAEWTGLVGGVLLLMWFMAMNGNQRSRVLAAQRLAKRGKQHAVSGQPRH